MVFVQVLLEVLDDKGQWVEIELPVGIRAVIFCNLQSYGGGRDLWKHGPQVWHFLVLSCKPAKLLWRPRPLDTCSAGGLKD